jgi:hypothetical protein
LNNGVGKTTGVVLRVIVAGMADTNGTLNGEGMFLVSGLEEVEMVVQGRRVEVVPPHDDVRIVEDLIRERVWKGASARRFLPRDVVGCR